MPILHSLWSLPAYRRFWLTRVATIMALQMLLVGLSWQLYSLHHRALDLALLGLISYLPLVLLVLVSGHAADRFDRRRLAMLCQAMACVIALLLAWWAWQGTLGRAHILILVFFLGCAKAFEAPALASLLPGLVPAPQLAQALSGSSAAMQVAVIIGPVLGGLLYQPGPPVLYVGASLLYLLALLNVKQIHLPDKITVAPTIPDAPQQLLAGIHFIRQHRRILGTLSLDLFAVLLGGATALLPMYAQDILHTGTAGMGLLRAAPAFGALGTAIFLHQQHSPLTKNNTMFMAVAGFGVFTIIFGLSAHLWLSCLALAGAGASDMISVVVRSTLVQTETPDVVRGRVNAINFLFIGTSNQLGEFESGLTAAWLGPVGAVVLGGIGSLLIALLWWHWFPELRTPPENHAR